MENRCSCLSESQSDHKHPHDHDGEPAHHDHHDHAGHHHPLPTSGSRLALVTLLNLVITAAELIGGLIAGSLALISDAVHNFGDGLAIVLAWGANRQAARPSDAHYTFGRRRMEILAAFINGLFLSVIGIFLLYEAGVRWVHPEPIRGALVLIVAVIGLIANLGSAALLFKGTHDSLNIKASYLHLLSDTISSVVVVIGGLLFMLGVNSRLDSILTAGLSVYMVYQGVLLLKQCASILLQAAPDIDLQAVQHDLTSIPGVLGIHHVHVWQLDDHTVHFEAHVCVGDIPVAATQALTVLIRTLLGDKYHVGHTMLQFETCNCADAGLIVDCSPHAEE